MSKVPHARRAHRALVLGVAVAVGMSTVGCVDVGDEGDDATDEVAGQQQQQQGRDNDRNGRPQQGGSNDRDDRDGRGRPQQDAGRGNPQPQDAGRGNAQPQDAGRGNTQPRDAGRGNQPTQPLPQQQQPTRPVGAPVAGGDAEGGFFLAVNANGSGCPAGSWNASISTDGQVFTMTFSAYEIRVNTTSQTSTLNCVLGLKLQSPRGLQFSLPTIYYSGYAFLEQGVNARQTASYNFRGGATVNQPVSQLRGPYDSDFVFTHSARTVQDRTWSPCGYDRVVNVNTQLSMQNGNPRASGYMNLAATDGSAPARVELRLAWRGCRANGPAPTFVEPRTASVARSAAPTTATIDGEQWSTPAISD